MNVFDIVTLAIIAVSVIVCTIKGFAKILLKIGAFILAVMLSRIFGEKLGLAVFPNLIKSDSISASSLNKINNTLAQVLGTAVLFIVLFIILRIISMILSKVIKNAPVAGSLDRLLGAVVGVLMGVAVVYVFAVALNIYASIATYLNPDSEIFGTLADTYIIKYFM